MPAKAVLTVTQRHPTEAPAAGDIQFIDGSSAAWLCNTRGELSRVKPIQTSYVYPINGWFSVAEARQLREAIAQDDGYRAAFREQRDAARQLRIATAHDRRYRAEPLEQPYEKMAPWPLSRMPALGEIQQISPERFIPALPPAEHAMALDLREATRRGEDFSEMLQSIMAAGFRIRPAISGTQEEGNLRLSGFRFMRDGIEIRASDARMLLAPAEGEPRAPVLARDAAMLTDLRLAYDADTAAHQLAQKALKAEIERISGAPTSVAEMLAEFETGGICARVETLQIYTGRDRGQAQPFNFFSFERDGVSMRIVPGLHGKLTRVALALISSASAEVASTLEEISGPA